MDAPAGFPEWPLGCKEGPAPLGHPANPKISAPAGIPSLPTRDGGGGINVAPYDTALTSADRSGV